MQLIEARIEPTAGQQLLVGAFFADPPLVEDDDPVRELNGREAVSDDQRGERVEDSNGAVADGRSNVMER